MCSEEKRKTKGYEIETLKGEEMWEDLRDGQPWRGSDPKQRGRARTERQMKRELETETDSNSWCLFSLFSLSSSSTHSLHSTPNSPTATAVSCSTHLLASILPLPSMSTLDKKIKKKGLIPFLHPFFFVFLLILLQTN